MVDELRLVIRAEAEKRVKGQNELTQTLKQERDARSTILDKCNKQLERSVCQNTSLFSDVLGETFNR